MRRSRSPFGARRSTAAGLAAATAAVLTLSGVAHGQEEKPAALPPPPCHRRPATAALPPPPCHRRPATAALPPPPGAADAGAPRMPARGGAVTLKVADFAAALQRVRDAARTQGAEVVDARTDVTEKGRRHGWVRLRLGADRLPALLAEVRQTGKLYAEKVSTADLVSEYEDLEQRVVRLREHRGRLDALLKSSRRLRGSDILYVQ